jgi:hypothetical protein
MNLYVYLCDGSMNLFIVWWFSLIHLDLIGISRALVICSAGPGTSPSMARRASGRPGMARGSLVSCLGWQFGPAVQHGPARKGIVPV